MIQPIYRTILLLIFIMTTVVGLFVWNVVSQNRVNKEELQQQGIMIYPQPRDMPDFRLTDYQSNNFTNNTLLGKWTILFFGFTSCPDICPTTLAELNKIATSISSQKISYPIQYVLVSIDPQVDTADRLKKYVTSFNPTFLGVRGEIDDVKSLATALSVIVITPEKQTMDHSQHQKQKPDNSEADEIDHSAQLVLISPDGKYYGFIKSGFTAEKIISVIPPIFNNF